MGHVIGYKNKIYPKGTGGGGSGSNVEPNPQDTPTDTLETIGIDGVVYEIEGGGGGTVYDMKDYYGQNGRICNGSARQFLTANFVKPLEVGRMYIIDFKNSEGGSIVASAVFTYNQDFSPTMYGGGSIGTIDMSITSTTITCTWYTGSWQDIYVDVYREISSAEFYHPVIYSTEEREIGVWTDNKPLYQKTFLFNQRVISDNAWTSNILGTVGSGIEIVDYEGMFGLENANPHFADFDYYRGSNEYFTAYIVNNNGSNDDIGVRPSMNAGANVTLDKCTIWYTKDSDTAGSGSYNTFGVPTVHYTTDEQVIGTWIDGKPLYEKTISIDGSYTGNGTFTIPNFPTGIDVKTYNGILSYEENGGFYPVGIGNNYLVYPYNAFDTIKSTIGSGTWHYVGSLTIQYTKTTD